MCLYCLNSLHELCVFPVAIEEEDLYVKCCCVNEQQPNNAVVIEPLGGYKQNEDITDQTSTGRKRAAMLYPVEDGMTCEWAWLKNAGGGAKPIVGCNGTVLLAAKGKHAVHHGPDKSTLNNEPTNVHRICVRCHNRWHAENDPLYPPVRPEGGAPFIPLSGEVVPHDAETKASMEDMFDSEMYWADKKSRKR